jgi:hypothetical protein
LVASDCFVLREKYCWLVANIIEGMAVVPRKPAAKKCKTELNPEDKTDRSNYL